MTLTEVVFRFRNRAHPWCLRTAADAGLRIVVHPLAWDATTRAWDALVTYAGPTAAAAVVEAETEADLETPEVVHQARDLRVLRARLPLARLTQSGNPLSFVGERFAHGSYFSPFLVEGGDCHVRLVASQPLDVPRAFAAFADSASATGWSDLKILRAEAFDPVRQAHGAFVDDMTQKQLELVRTALALGYYDTPRAVTMDHLADIFGVSKAAVHTRLVTAERKIIKKFFD